ncbi:MAG: CocE/NonD family hydrolase [Saprospirales bacterium]|nr:CocE/NonD family hydrolase [Saprospirales bacterium]
MKLNFLLAYYQNLIWTNHKKEIEFFTSYGYAVVIIDVRGTGASFGTRYMEFSPEEVEDGREIVDWIITQNWSNQKVGSTGISYLGTTAEMLLVNQHPNVSMHSKKQHFRFI